MKISQDYRLIMDEGDRIRLNLGERVFVIEAKVGDVLYIYPKGGGDDMQQSPDCGTTWEHAGWAELRIIDED